MIGIIVAYMKLNELARVLRSSNPSSTQVETFAKKALEFSQHMQHILGTNSIATKSYLHVLVECFPRFITFWYEHLGIGSAVWSTSCGESKNVHCSNGEKNHSNSSPDSMIQVMKYDLRSCSYCPDTTQKRSLTCSNCNKEGHEKKNKSCTMHVESRTHCSFPQLEEQMSIDEMLMAEAYSGAYEQYFKCSKKQSIKHLKESSV